MLRRRLAKRDSPVCALCQYRLSQTSQASRAQPLPIAYRHDRLRARALHATTYRYSDDGAWGSPSVKSDSSWGPPKRPSSTDWGSTTSSTSPAQPAFAIPKRRTDGDLAFLREAENRAKAAQSQASKPETPPPQAAPPTRAPPVDPRVRSRYVWNAERQRSIERSEARDFAPSSRGNSPFRPPPPSATGLPTLAGLSAAPPARQTPEPLSRLSSKPPPSGSSSISEPQPTRPAPSPQSSRPPSFMDRTPPPRRLDSPRSLVNEQIRSERPAYDWGTRNPDASPIVLKNQADRSASGLNSDNSIARRSNEIESEDINDWASQKNAAKPVDPFQRASLPTSPLGPRQPESAVQVGPPQEWDQLARKSTARTSGDADLWNDMLKRVIKKPAAPISSSPISRITQSETTNNSFGSDWPIRGSENSLGTTKRSSGGDWGIHSPGRSSEARMNRSDDDWGIRGPDSSFGSARSSLGGDWDIRGPGDTAKSEKTTASDNPDSERWDIAEPPSIDPRMDQNVKPTNQAVPPPSPYNVRDSERSRRRNDFDRESRGSKGRGKQPGGGGKGRRGRRDDDDDFDYEEYQDRKTARQQRKAQREAERTDPIPILLPELINVSTFAKALKIEPQAFLTQLSELGFEGVQLDSLMAGETAALVAQEYGYEPTVEAGASQDLKPRPPPEDLSAVPPRPPVVTIMGHVDHGKTTLLDFLRQASVAAQEHGGITQHIGAFSVKLSSGKPITFLDTPGHAAFLTMRQRGANVTDIVVLVVAADDSVKPQTLEALKHARAAKVPMIVAITKVDKEGARIEAVKNDLSQAGVELEDFGGDVQVVCVSGKTGQGMDDLEENILTLSEILDHRAEPDGPAEGWVLESSLKASGKVATILVKRGTLRLGDHIAAGRTWAKIRNLRNEAGAEVAEAPPGTPVEIVGWKELPAAGDQVLQGENEDTVKKAVSYRIGLYEREQDAAEHEVISEARKAYEEKRAQEKEENKAHAVHTPYGVQELPTEDNGTKLVNFSVKGDVHGSVEAVCAVIQEIGNHEVRPRILRSATGPVTEFDVEHAAMSKSFIVNFATDTPSSVAQLADEQGVKILDHNIIYRLVDDVKTRLSEYLAPTLSTRVLGEAEILQIFPINTRGRHYKNIAGCRVRNGVVAKTSLYRVIRNGETLFEGKLETLKNVKKDVTEMRKGTECGMGFEGYQDLEVGDQIQAYEEVSTPRSF